MSETEPTEPEPTERLDRLETVVDQIKAAVERLAAGRTRGVHEDSQDAVERRLDRPTTVEEQVAAALAAKEKTDRENALHEDVGSLKETVGKLAEAPPQPPERRIERVMGWGR